MYKGTFPASRIERVVCGEPAAAVLRTEAERRCARRVFLMVSGTMNRTTDEIERMRTALGPLYAGLYDRMPAHTPRDAVLEAAAAARTARADLIVTFGGGSVTDAGKMVRLCLRHQIVDMDAFDRFRTVVNPDGSRTVPEFAAPEVPQIAIPTTLSGGEFHSRAGCSDPRRRAKHGYRHAALLPVTVVLDPAPTTHTPLWVWLSTGLRALDHAVEGICSTHANPVSDAHFLHAVRLLTAALPRVKRDPQDLAARLDCQFGVWMSMAGRQGGVQMGASHAIGHVLGGTCGVPHGYTSCVMLPHVLRYNSAVTSERQRLIAEAMGSRAGSAPDLIAALVSALELPGRLSEVGVERAQFRDIAAHALRDEWMHANPRRITREEEILEILEAAA